MPLSARRQCWLAFKVSYICVRARSTLSLSLLCGARLAVIAANVRTDERLSEAAIVSRTGLSVYRSCTAHLHPESMNSLSTIIRDLHWCLITEERGSSEASLAWKMEERLRRARRQSEDERSSWVTLCVCLLFSSILNFLLIILLALLIFPRHAFSYTYQVIYENYR